MDASTGIFIQAAAPLRDAVARISERGSAAGVEG